jgi:hypothetical protein
MTSISTVIAVAKPNSTGREKKIVKSCTWASLAGGRSSPPAAFAAGESAS